MADAGYITPEAAERADPASRSPSSSARSKPRRRTSSTSSARRSTSEYPGLTTTTDQAVDVYTTLDLHLQRLAQDAVRDGLTQVDELLARPQAQGQGRGGADRVDPRTGEILALVGGRSYNQSQYNRAIVVAPPARLGVQAVRLPAAFEQAAARGPHRRHAGVDRRRRAGRRSSSTTRCGRRRTTRTSTTARSRSGTRSRTRATSRRSRSPSGRLRPRRRALEEARRRQRRPKPYPSIALGVFEATPFEIATAYTIFPNMRHRSGRCSTSLRITQRRQGRHEAGSRRRARAIARPDTTYLVTNMMRSVLNEGTGGGARARRLHARRRRQDRHDQRSARRLVRRLHARTADGRLGRLRRQPAGRPERRAGGAADLDAVHEARARRPRRASPFDGARRHRVRRTSTRTPASSRRRPARNVISRGVHRRHRAARCECRASCIGEPRQVDGLGGPSSPSVLIPALSGPIIRR